MGQRRQRALEPSCSLVRRTVQSRCCLASKCPDQVFGSDSPPHTCHLQVIQFLLANNLRLTALELLVEAPEAGGADDVTPLQDFFKDPELFPPERVAKFQGVDGTALCPGYSLAIEP